MPDPESTDEAILATPASGSWNEGSASALRVPVPREAEDERVDGDPVDRLSRLVAPTGDIADVLAEIDAGRDS